MRARRHPRRADVSVLQQPLEVGENIRARPSLVDRPDRQCPLPKFAHFQRAVGRPGESKTQRTQPCIHQYTLPGLEAREFSVGLVARGGVAAHSR